MAGTNNHNSLVTDIVAGFVNAISGSAFTPASVHGNTANISSDLNASPPFASITDPDQATGDQIPRAYLNVIFFNERFEFVSEGSTALRVSQSGDNAAPLVLSNIKVPKNGYSYIYLSNENDDAVYFDNFTVSDTRGRIIEEDHYYAFGLRIDGISSRKLDVGLEGSLKNTNLYNDKELFNDADLDWYDYGFRNYDAQIGRFPQLDPLTDDYPELTPYQYASDEPIANVDMDGLEKASSIISEFIKEGGKPLQEVVVKGLSHAAPAAAKVGTSILSKAATALNAVGKGIGWFGKGLWNEGVMPTLDWVNHNVNPVYGVFNGINSQFTGQDFFNGSPMTHAEGITDAALPFIPFGKVGGVVEKTVFKTVEKVATKEETKLITQFSTSTIDDAVGIVMKDPNKISHLFAGKHNLDVLVTKFGGQESTLRAVFNAANGKLPASGVFNNISVSVGGQNLLIRGSVINGVPRLGTMFIP